MHVGAPARSFRPAVKHEARASSAWARCIEPLGAARPLAGAQGWIITDGKAGMDVQARGVADALGLAVE